MKRRVMIAKALSHEPDILFLDEPTAGVDVELRRDMWELVRKLRADGTTIILTTHYIEEAEEMADRVGVISKGELIAVDDKSALMAKMGKQDAEITLAEPLERGPARACANGTSRSRMTATALLPSSTAMPSAPASPSLMRRLGELGIGYKDLSTHQSSLEDIFVELVHEPQGAAHERAWRRRHLPLRNGALGAHPVAEPDHAGDHHRALFRGVRLRDRQPHDDDGRHQLTAASSCPA